MASVDLACIIYVHEVRDKLVETLKQVLPEKNSRSIFRAYGNEIEVLKNLDFDPIRCKEFPNGFLHFQQRIEIFPENEESVDLDNQVAFVSSVLQHLWSNHIPSVAACDYEEQLPYCGGYQSQSAPWVGP